MGPTEVLHNSVGISELPKPSIFNPSVTSQEKTTTQSLNPPKRKI